MRAAVTKPRQSHVLLGPDFAVTITEPGFHVTIEQRAPLTIDEHDAFVASGGEFAFYDLEDQFDIFINDTLAETLGEPET